MKRLGAYYREKVLSQKKLKEITLPRKKDFDDKVWIEPALFGFRLHTEREHIELEKEEEARFGKIFLETGLRTVMVPGDLDYLKKILPELTELKEKHDQVINENLEYIFSRRRRREISSLVWSQVMWEEAKPSGRPKGKSERV